MKFRKINKPIRILAAIGLCTFLFAGGILVAGSISKPVQAVGIMPISDENVDVTITEMDNAQFSASLDQLYAQDADNPDPPFNTTVDENGELVSPIGELIPFGDGS